MLICRGMKFDQLLLRNLITSSLNLLRKLCLNESNVLIQLQLPFKFQKGYAIYRTCACKITTNPQNFPSDRGIYARIITSNRA